MGKKTDFVISVLKQSKPVANKIGHGAKEVGKAAGTAVKIAAKIIIWLGKAPTGG